MGQNNDKTTPQAEQFFATFTGREYNGHYGELDVFAFAEAFRDKSETINIEHIAFSILHGTFNPKNPGGCSCNICDSIRTEIDKQAKYEAAKFYNEHYPPQGGLL